MLFRSRPVSRPLPGNTAGAGLRSQRIRYGAARWPCSAPGGRCSRLFILILFRNSRNRGGMADNAHGIPPCEIVACILTGEDRSAMIMGEFQAAECSGKAVRIRHCPATVSDGQGPQKATVSACRDGKARAGRSARFFASQVRRPIRRHTLRFLFPGAKGERACQSVCRSFRVF